MPAITATDADTGVNAEVTFNLTGPGSEYFIINASTGVITTAAILDYEAVSELSGLVLRVMDRGGLYSTVNLSVTVLDINDHTPMFTNGDDNISVPENHSVGEVITVLTAIDSDSGDNGRLTFSITSMEGVFALDPTSGALVLLAPLDFESQQQYYLNISVADQGSPPRTSHTEIVIRVTDANDNAPHFLEPLPMLSVVENSPASTVVGQLLATDADSLDRGLLTFSIVTGNENGHFSIVTSSGELTLAKSVDREVQELHELMVEVSQDSCRHTSLCSTAAYSPNTTGPRYSTKLCRCHDSNQCVGYK